MAAVLALAGCTGGSAGPRDPFDSAAGGTLTLLATDPLGSLDPAAVTALPAINLSTRLLSRTLTAYAAEPSPGGAEVVADLATDTGTPNADATQWSWTLKSGVAWQDGTPVTCEDVKYGIARGFAEGIAGQGPGGPADYLALPVDRDGAPVYRGPYEAASAGQAAYDRAVSCAGATLTVRLNQPAPDFDAVVARPSWAPVPRAADEDPQTGGAGYGAHVVSNGPYQVSAFAAGGLTLVRNPAWDRSTDPVRRAFPDSIVVQSGLDPAALAARMVADAPADETSIMANSTLGADALAVVDGDDGLASRLVEAPTGRVRYLAINAARVTDEKVRAAIVTAVDREAWRSVYGGEALGTYADGAVPPSLPGGGQVTAFAGLAPQGDPEAAKVLLAEAGATNVRLILDCPDTAEGVQAAEVLKTSLAEARIAVTVRPVPAPYAAGVGVAAEQGDLTLAEWSPEWASAAAILPPLFAPDQIAATGNRVLSQFADPELQRLIDAAWAADGTAQAADSWAAVNQYVVERALLVPLAFDTTRQLVGSRVANAFAHPFFGQADLAVLAVRPAKTAAS